MVMVMVMLLMMMMMMMLMMMMMTFRRAGTCNHQNSVKQGKRFRIFNGADWARLAETPSDHICLVLYLLTKWVPKL